MAYEEAIRTITAEAAGDLSTKQHTFVVADSNGRVTTAGAAARAFGVQRNKPSALGHATTVIRGGTCKVIAGEAIAKGDQVTSDAAGKAQVATTGEFVAGVALTAASAADQVISVNLTLEGRPAAA